MHSLMGIITNTKSAEILKELTLHRCMPAVPFGGRYRLIDFPLSNMVNSGVRNVGVVINHKYRSLMDHLGSGKDWGLDRKAEGLYWLPAASPGIIQKTTRFDLGDLYHNSDYLQKCHQQHIVISGSNMVCNVNFKKALQFHKDSKCDITIFYKDEKIKHRDYDSLTFLELDSNGRLLEVAQSPERNGLSKIFIEMMILDRGLLLNIIRVAKASGNWDLIDIIKENLDELRVYGYAHIGYLGKISSVASYYQHNLDLLRQEVWRELFLNNGAVYTKDNDGPPVKYGEKAQISNALVATGCNIQGLLYNSVVFRSVTAGAGSSVKNSIIMQKCVIEQDVVLENVILDTEVTIRRGIVLIGDESHPIVIAKNTVV